MYSSQDSLFVTLFLGLTKYFFLVILGVFLAWMISLVFNLDAAAAAIFSLVLPWVARVILVGGCVAVIAVICESLR